LKAYLADRDTKCPGCGYNLRGLASSTCPECAIALSQSKIENAAAAATEKKLVRNTDLAAGITLAVLILTCAWITLQNRDPQGALALICPIFGLGPSWMTATVWPAYFRWSPDTRRRADEIFTAIWAWAAVGAILVVLVLFMARY
jgi:hypothetical protein